MQTFYAANDCSKSEKEFGTKIPNLLQDLDNFEQKVANGTAHERPRRFMRIGVYNSFWNTLGASEHTH